MELGVALYSPTTVAKNIDEGMLNYKGQEKLEENEIETGELGKALKKICSRMEKSAVPLNFIHGDLEQSNFLSITKVEGDRIKNESAKKSYLNRWKLYACDDNISHALNLAYLVLLCNNLYVLL